MILLDTDVLIIDLRYLRDARFAANRRFLDHCQLQRLPLAITCQTLLEVVGKFSFNVAAADIAKLADQIPRRYGLCPRSNAPRGNASTDALRHSCSRRKGRRASSRDFPAQSVGTRGTAA